MAREITCYVYDRDDRRYVTEYLVMISPRPGYTAPTVREMDDLEGQLSGKLHKTPAALARMAHSSPYDLDVTIDDRGSVCREKRPEDLQDQAEQYDADSVRHLRANH